MKEIKFPSEFPDRDTLINNIQDTSMFSWVIGDFNQHNISAWLDNFQGAVFKKEDEQRIALWLLSNYTYYNKKEIDHLCSVLYRRFIHTYITDEMITKDELKANMKNFCYIPLGHASESGGFIAYYFRIQARIGIDRFFFPTDELDNEGEVAIFIDDVTLSATQAKTLITEFKSKHSFNSIYLLTLISSMEAVKELAENDIKTISCIELDERNKCFSQQSILFHRFPDLHDEIKELCSYYGERLYTGHPLGYKDGQYLFGFFYNTPNNTLPIFWAKKNGWRPIFERKGKIKNDERAWRPFEKYI